MHGFNAAVSKVRKAHKHLSQIDATKVVQIMARHGDEEIKGKDMKEIDRILGLCATSKCPVFHRSINEGVERGVKKITQALDSASEALASVGI